MTPEELETALAKIRANMCPEEVFPREELLKWARTHEEPQNIYSVSEMLVAIRFKEPE